MYVQKKYMSKAQSRKRNVWLFLTLIVWKKIRRQSIRKHEFTNRAVVWTGKTKILECPGMSDYRPGRPSNFQFFL